MKAYKNYILVQRPLREEKTSSGGIILPDSNDTHEMVLKCKVISMFAKDQAPGIKEGDEILVEKRNALTVEYDDGIYALDPKYIVAKV